MLTRSHRWNRILDAPAARYRGSRPAKVVALALGATTLITLGGSGANAVRGQPPGLGSDGPTAPPCAGCRGLGQHRPVRADRFQRRGLITLPIATYPASTTDQAITMKQNCAGPVYASYAAVVNSRGSDTLLRIETLCTVGGCAVTGAPIVAEPFRGGGSQIADFTSGVKGGDQVTATGTFVNLPRDRYTLQVRLTAFDTGASVVLTSLTAQSYGPPTPALP